MLFNLLWIWYLPKAFLPDFGCLEPFLTFKHPGVIIAPLFYLADPGKFVRQESKKQGRMVQLEKNLRKTGSSHAGAEQL